MDSKELKLNTDTNYKVYTPKHIARRMLASIFIEYFKGDKKEKLDNLRAVDIACGTGNLLLVLIESLIKISKIYYGSYTYNEDWVVGYDIDKEALEIFHIRFKKLLDKYKLQGEIRLYHENSLLNLHKERYNIVIGNPPYLGEKNNKEIFEDIKKTEFGEKYYEGRMDYLYYFIIKGIDLLKPNGVLSYITTNYWLRADYAKKLRKKIKEETSFSYICNYNKSVFKNVHGQHNMIFTLSKVQGEVFKVEDESEIYYSDNRLIFDREEKIVLAPKEKLIYFENILKRKTHYLGELLNINQGIVSGCDKAYVMKEYNELFSEYLKPFYKSTDVGRYQYTKENLYWILYMNKDVKPNDRVLDYLSNFKDKLLNRREVKKGQKLWWELQWGRKENIFKEAKIVGPQRSLGNRFALVEGDFYASADVYYLTPKNQELDLYYILAYLNTKVFYNWFKYNGKSKGVYLELYATPLKQSPIYYPDDKAEIERISNLARILIQNHDPKVEEEIEKHFSM